MTLLALLVSGDDSAAEILGRILPASGVVVERFSDTGTAIDRLQRQRFDAIIVDFSDLESAHAIIEEARRLSSGHPPVTVALVSDAGTVRNILSGGAHFVLYKPLSEDRAKAGLRAVTALLNRERRRAFRVPVQAPVELTLPNTQGIEGILLDLSETGMDVLTAEQQVPAALLQFRFQLPGGSLEIAARGQVAWANPNGQTGVHFLDLPESTKTELKEWLRAAAASNSAGPGETVPHCKLTDLSLGGCYVETDSPFPEQALVDLCLKTDEMEVHTEGMVRVTHPDHGMGVEFPSRTPEQRAQVENLIGFLRNSPEAMLELYVSPRSLTADLKEFEPASDSASNSNEEMEDSLLQLLREGPRLQQDDFLQELRRQRGEPVAS
ncbi:MAG TPA: PilZ domain-containing protein [Candidatus Aquilonibacter sp.]|nr:PilZ domain-containing protein [Candidatus Aquilonibacter sp.]